MLPKELMSLVEKYLGGNQAESKASVVASQFSRFLKPAYPVENGQSICKYTGKCATVRCPCKAFGNTCTSNCQCKIDVFKQVNIVITVYNNVYNPPKILQICIHTSVHYHVNSFSKFKMSVQTSGGSKFVLNLDAFHINSMPRICQYLLYLPLCFA